MTNRKKLTSWDEIKTRRKGRLEHSPEFQEEFAELRFARMIQKLRQQLELTQEELAERMGVSQPHVAKLEAGRSVPAFETMTRFAEAIGLRLVIGVVSEDELEHSDDLQRLVEHEQLIATSGQ
jgi:transcriptional regulator with XRE-family HTH domain